jgi:hypothetical protein
MAFSLQHLFTAAPFHRGTFSPQHNRSTFHHSTCHRITFSPQHMFTAAPFQRSTFSPQHLFTAAPVTTALRTRHTLRKLTGRCSPQSDAGMRVGCWL